LGGEKLKRKKVFFILFLIFSILYTGLPVFAQESDPVDPTLSEDLLPNPEEQYDLNDVDQDSVIQSETGMRSTGWVMFQIILVLALSALAIYGIVYFIKRLGKPSRAKDPHLKVLATTPLGTSSYAAVISVGSKAWLVGGGDSGVSLISEITEQEVLESMLIDEARKNPAVPTGRFAEFQAFLKKFTKNNFGASAENLRKQRDRLKGI